MTEPILTRDELNEIERKCDITFFVPDDSETFPGTYVNLRQLRDYAARIEAAVLEKVCGKPAAWAATSEEGVVEALGFNQSRRFDTPLFALTRSKP